MTTVPDVPDDFPYDTLSAVVPGVQPKIGVRLTDGRYVAGQTAEKRAERWEICEDLAQQLVYVARKDEEQHSGQAREVTIERVRVSVARKAWCSSAELEWLMRRLSVLLAT